MENNLITIAAIGNIISVVSAVIRKGAGNDYSTVVDGRSVNSSIESLVAIEVSRAIQTAPAGGK